MMHEETAGQTWTSHPWITEGRQRVRYGILSLLYLPWEQVLEQVLFVEKLGYDSVLIYDHPTNAGSAGCWTTLAQLAAVTKQIRLISLVSCVYYYHPAILARMAADVDHVSHGRLVLGLGIGDDTDEFQQMGIPLPPVRERQERLEETLQIIQGLWRGEPFSYQGTHFQLQGANGHPLPVQQPRVPILIGGGGERVTLRQVAQYADMSNFGPHIWTGSAFHPEDVKRKYEVLDSHCQTLSRPPETILHSYFVPTLLIARTLEEQAEKLQTYPIQESARRGAIVGTPEEVREQIQALVNLSIRYFTMCVSPGDTETLEIFANEVMPAIHCT